MGEYNEHILNVMRKELEKIRQSLHVNQMEYKKLKKIEAQIQTDINFWGKPIAGMGAEKKEAATAPQPESVATPPPI